MRRGFFSGVSQKSYGFKIIAQRRVVNVQHVKEGHRSNHQISQNIVGARAVKQVEYLFTEYSCATKSNVSVPVLSNPRKNTRLSRNAQKPSILRQDALQKLTILVRFLRD
jgi:hypothetical protein